MKKLLVALAAVVFGPAALAQNTIKVGIVAFISGPAAAPFGVPAKNAAEFVIDELNAGKGPAPYASKGFGGSAIETVIIDEAGSTTTQVTEFRNLVQRQNVDLVIGYISSGNCLAIAPVAEELKKFTNFFDCGTPRIFEDASYKYVFRTSPTATMDSVGAALYVKDARKSIKSIAGINQNYAWGQDSWGDFEAAMKVLVPGVEVKTSQMPKLFAGQYNAEISAILGAKADVVHSSFWDGDLEALILQGGPRGLMKSSMTILTTGETAMHKLGSQIPDGTVLGARGPFGPYAPKNPYNSWFSTGFQKRYNAPPNSASYQMAQAILGSNADVLHSSFFDGDLEALLLQGAPRELMKKSLTVLTTGETAMYKLPQQSPDGTILGARGPFGVYAPANAYNKWYAEGYRAKYKEEPNYASYQMVQAILGVKAAFEKAMEKSGGKKPTNEQVGDALKGAEFDGPGGHVKMALGKGHQAVMETVYGQTKLVNGKITMVNVKRYPAEKVNPPEGVKAADWIKAGFKK